MSGLRQALISASGVLACGLALAADAADKPRFELTPYVGYRMGGEFDLDNPPPDTSSSADLDSSASWGVDLGIYRDRNSFYEVLYSHQSAGVSTDDPSLDGKDVSIQYLQAGGTLLFPHEHYVPWLSLTVGATWFDAGGSYGSETKFSGSLGGGVRFPFGDRFAATLGLRGYWTVVESDTAFFCSGSGSVNCLFKTTGGAFFQGEALLGFTAVF
ncbi:MAG: outer membrane beta-barrel protein [Steroidobacteraceae bacterium]